MDEGLEKEYILRQLKCLKELTGEYPAGWYYGRLSARSKALVWEAYKELDIPLVWESDSYCDDLPYWVDVPAEKDSENPEGMLMVPYSYVSLECSLKRPEADFAPGMTVTTSNSIQQQALSRRKPSSSI